MYFIHRNHRFKEKMPKKSLKILTNSQILEALGQETGENPPTFTQKALKNYRLRYRTVKRFIVVPIKPTDVETFAMTMRIVPSKGDDIELVQNENLYKLYFDFSDERDVQKKNAAHYGREMRRLGIVKIRRTIFGKRIFYRCVRKNNLLPKGLITKVEGDNERRQNRSIYKASVSRFQA